MVWSMNKVLAILIFIIFNVSFADDHAVVLNNANTDYDTKKSTDEIPSQVNGIAAATKQAIKEGSGKESDSTELIKNENYRTISSEEIENEN